jgi:glycosyltransferase involved in cell wall biosynthesis
MIIVDDGSTDKTAEFVSQFKDPRINYFKQNHVGPWRLAETYNFALSKSSGKYIAILEGDDYWPPDKLIIQYEAMENHPEAIMCYGESLMVSESGKEISYFYLPKEQKTIKNNPVGSSLSAFFDLQLFIQAVTLIIKRSVLDKIGGFQYSEVIPAVDYPTSLRLCLEGPFLPIHGKCLGYWRRHMKSISINYQLDAWKGMANHNLIFLENHCQEMLRLGFNYDKAETQNKLEQKINFVSTHYYYHSGFLFLALKEYKLAREMFLNYLSNKPNYHKKVMVYLGLISSLIKVDLVHEYRSYRNKIRKLKV